MLLLFYMYYSYIQYRGGHHTKGLTIISATNVKYMLTKRLLSHNMLFGLNIYFIQKKRIGHSIQRFCCFAHYSCIQYRGAQHTKGPSIISVTNLKYMLTLKVLNF